MLATYGVDVLDPAVTPRRIAVLLDALPPYARRPGEHWSTEAELLATLIDQIANLTWITARAAGAKSVSRPRPIPRPGRAAIAREPARNPRAIRGGTWSDAIAMIAGLPGVKVTGGGDG